MARYKLVAFSNAAPGCEGEFNDWYDQQHMPDVLAIPGFISAERYVSVGEGRHKYMAIYEIETEDLGALLEDFGKRPGTELMPISDALDVQSGLVGFWQPKG